MLKIQYTDDSPYMRLQQTCNEVEINMQTFSQQSSPFAAKVWNLIEAHNKRFLNTLKLNVSWHFSQMTVLSRNNTKIYSVMVAALVQTVVEAVFHIRAMLTWTGASHVQGPPCFDRSYTAQETPRDVWCGQTTRPRLS